MRKDGNDRGNHGIIKPNRCQFSNLLLFIVANQRQAAAGHPSNSTEKMLKNPHLYVSLGLLMTGVLTAAPHRTQATVTSGDQKIAISLTGNLENFADLKPRFDKMAKIYSDVWPKLVHMLGSPIDASHRDVVIIFEPKMDHPAHASGNRITISAEHLRRDPADTEGVFIHELTHVIQRYSGPGWLVEGVADYTRFKLKSDDAWGKRCRGHIAYDKPFGAYWNSAAFLLYLEDTYKKPVVRTVSVAMRAGKFNDAVWKNLTGKTLQELALDYKSSGWKPAP